MVVRPSALQRGGDKNAPAATFGAYLCAVRTMLRIVRIQHCKRQKGVRQGGISPLTLFCFLLQEQKEGHGGEPYWLCTLHILRNADRRLQTIPHRVGIQVMPLQKAPPTSLQRKFFLPPKKESSRLPPTAHFFTYYSIPVSCFVIRSQPM